MRGKALRISLSTALCVMLVFCGVAFAANYDHEISIQKITFAWKVDGENLDVKLADHTTGWVGIGFNPNFMMKGARFVLGYVKDGKTVLSNQFGDASTHHEPIEKLGEKSGVNLISGKEENGVTTLEFTIPLASPGAHGKTIDPGAITTILLAYGPDFDSFRFKHRFRVKLHVNLTTGKYTK